MCTTILVVINAKTKIQTLNRKKLKYLHTPKK